MPRHLGRGGRDLRIWETDRRRRGVLLAALASVLMACASVEAYTTQYVGAPHYPPSDPARVEILRTEPTRPHERLGEIVLDASTDPAPPIAAYVTGPWWDRDLQTVTGRKLVGVAIKYQK